MYREIREINAKISYKVRLPPTPFIAFNSQSLAQLFKSISFRDLSRLYDIMGGSGRSVKEVGPLTFSALC